MSNELQHAITVGIWALVILAILSALFYVIFFVIIAKVIRKTQKEVFGGKDPFDNDFFNRMGR